MRRAFISILFSLTTCGISAELRSSGLIAAGSRWETPYQVIEAQEPGPTLILTGGIHGDEPAGARAAEQICEWPLLRGRLIIIPRANVPALKAGKRLIPGTKTGERDLNRNFPRAGSEEGTRGELAAHLWDFVAAQHPDWLIDLHEGYDFHRLQPGSVGSSIIDCNSDASDAAAPVMLSTVNATIADPQRWFVNLSLPVEGSLARAAAEQLGAFAMIVETTSRDQPLSLRTRQHRIMVHQLLLRLGMVSQGSEAAIIPPPSPGPRVAIFDDKGAGGGGPPLMEATLRELPGSIAWRVGAEDVRQGALDRFDLAIFPGGSGSSQAKALGERGRHAVRRFVEQGGGYVGICAGAYLSASNYDWSLAFSNQRTFADMREIPGKGMKSMWYRGPSSLVSMELSDAGKQIFGDHPGEIQVRYHNGPIVPPMLPNESPTYEVLAWFRSEVSHYEPQEGTMTDTPAMISTRHGKGRVLAISPHPEASKALRPMLAKGMAWAARN
jgi:predicted deacylase/glutamine amidotransferase-like uncharacterized protein